MYIHDLTIVPVTVYSTSWDVLRGVTTYLVLKCLKLLHQNGVDDLYGKFIWFRLVPASTRQELKTFGSTHIQWISIDLIYRGLQYLLTKI